MVIPATICQKAGLKPGTELEIVVDDLAIHIIRRDAEPKLVRRGKRLVAKPAARSEDLPKLDLAALVEEERNRWPL